MSKSGMYGAVVDALRLVAATPSVQMSVLPEFVHVPDEILLAVVADDVSSLIAKGEIPEKLRADFGELEAMLDEVWLYDEYEDALRQVQVDPQFQRLREKATRLLGLLGESVDRPTLSGTVWVS